MRPGDIVIAHLPSGETHARYVRVAANRKGHVVDIGGARVTVAVARPVPAEVQS